MNTLVFRTGLPFGYALFAIVLVGLALVGVVLIAHGLWRRKVWRTAIGAVLIALVGAIVSANLAADRDVDLNPMIRNDSFIVGAWYQDADTLDVRADHSYTCHGRTCQDLARAGTWARVGDFDIVFRSIGGEEVSRRVVHYRNQYRLTVMPDDPDEWDGDLSFGIGAPAN
jgi:hypothetical protein